MVIAWVVFFVFNLVIVKGSEETAYGSDVFWSIVLGPVFTFWLIIIHWDKKVL